MNATPERLNDMIMFYKLFFHVLFYFTIGDGGTFQKEDFRGESTKMGKIFLKIFVVSGM